MAKFIMPWNELHITTSPTYANAVSDQLTEWGAQAVTFQDAGDQPLYEPSPETPRLWPETVVIGLFDSEDSLSAIITDFEKQAEQGLIQYLRIQPVADEDWERRCLDRFQPICFGQRLWICPSWHTPPDPNAVNVILDPGLAFGTGSHPTTALCLEWLDQNIHTEELIIDYGCGSGILGIAALKLGAKKVLAVDNDPQALLATRDNAERNHIDSKALITILPNECHAVADIVIANILAQPLIDLASQIAQLTRPGGQILLSGILSEQVNDVICAYRALFVIKSPTYKDGWVRIEAIRK